MKRNNASTLPSGPRSDEDQVEGTIVVNEREDDHYITTGFFDSACRDLIASPLHYPLMRELEQAAGGAGKTFSLFLAESYWGREQYLGRLGVVPYNSALFKICERVAQGTSPVSEIYHLYEDHYRHALAPGTELMGMLGNHDERRPVNTFGRDNLRPVLTLTSFLTNLLLDYEGNADGEAWKVFADNVYVDWNRFDSAADRSVERVFSEVYAFHRRNPGRGTLVPTDHEQVAAAIKPAPRGLWLAVCSFSADSATVSADLRTAQAIDEAARYVVVDPTYSPVTRGYAHYTGRELRVTPLTTSVSYRQRVKLLRIDLAGADSSASELLRDSFDRLLAARSREQVAASFAYRALAGAAASRDRLLRFLDETVLPLYDAGADEAGAVGLKRALYHAHREAGARTGTGAGLGHLHGGALPAAARAGGVLARALELLRRRPVVFVSAEAEPFSKSGGLANVTFELPRELARLGESMYVITPLYRNGDARAVAKMRDAVARFGVTHTGVTHTGVTVHFQLGDEDFEVGVHRGVVEGVTYFLLDHHDLFDGLYWGYRSNERIRRRLALGRAAAEVMVRFGIQPQVVATNDAAASLVSGIVRGDPHYAGGATFADTSFVHIIHNGGWQYFDCYDRYEEGADLFGLFNLPVELASRFTDPRDDALFNLMAAGIRFADQVFTVSPTYARQIEQDCDGLEALLHDVIGINNGIGKDFRRGVAQRLARSGLEQRHAPRLRERIETDRELRDKLERRFPELLADGGKPASFRNAARRDEVLRMRTKLIAQLEYGLTVDPDQVLYVMIHRVSDQKGFQILLDASQGMFRDLGVQAILGGPIAPNDQRAEQLAAGMRALMEYYPGSVATRIGYQEISLPLLAADAFLMPSEFEPGGISQLEAMSCGCVVVAHATGGLRDTVTPLQVSGAAVRGGAPHHGAVVRRRPARAPAPGTAARHRRHSRPARARYSGRRHPHERGPFRVPRAGAHTRADERTRSELLGSAPGGVEHQRVHHPHPGAGRQRELRRPPGARPGGAPARRAGAERGGVPGARPRRPRQRPRRIRPDPAGPALGRLLQRRQPAARAGVAPHVERSVAGRAGRRGADPAHHQRRAPAQLDFARYPGSAGALPGFARPKVRAGSIGLGTGGQHRRRGAVAHARAPPRAHDLVCAAAQSWPSCAASTPPRRPAGRRGGVASGRTHHRIRAPFRRLQAGWPAVPPSRAPGAPAYRPGAPGADHAGRQSASQRPSGQGDDPPHHPVRRRPRSAQPPGVSRRLRHGTLSVSEAGAEIIAGGECVAMELVEQDGEIATYRTQVVCHSTGRLGATVRITPTHPALAHQLVPGLFRQG